MQSIFWGHFFGVFEGKFGRIRAKILRTPKKLPAPKPMHEKKQKHQPCGSKFGLNYNKIIVRKLSPDNV